MSTVDGKVDRLKIRAVDVSQNRRQSQYIRECYTPISLIGSENERQTARCEHSSASLVEGFCASKRPAHDCVPTAIIRSSCTWHKRMRQSVFLVETHLFLRRYMRFPEATIPSLGGRET